MKTVRYLYWKDEDRWLGHFEEFPDYITQGEDLEDLKENLKDTYATRTSGESPIVRRVGELSVA